MLTAGRPINKLKVDKLTGWVTTGLLVIIGFPFFKNIIVSILVKLYELFIQQAIER